MESSRLQKAKATQTIHIKRLRTGLGFSVKGGREHGIPIVVCDVEIKGAACVCVHACLHVAVFVTAYDILKCKYGIYPLNYVIV